MKYLTLLPIRLHLHDEAGAVGTSSSMTGESGAPQTAEPVIQYGKAPGDIQASSEQGGTPAAQAPTEPTSTPEDRTKAYADFKNQYKDLYQADVQGALGQRLKSREKELGELRSILDPLQAQLGIRTRAEMAEWIRNDILPKVKDSDTYKALSAVAGEAGEALESGNGAPQDGEADVSTKAAEWVSQGVALSEKLKATGETFDLPAEMANPRFETLLKSGLTVEEAYRVSHFDDIVLKQTKAAAETTRHNVIEAIRTKGLSAVTENAAKPAPPVIVKDDPSKWTAAEMLEVKRRVARGESIYL